MIFENLRYLLMWSALQDTGIIGWETRARCEARSAVPGFVIELTGRTPGTLRFFKTGVGDSSSFDRGS